MFSDWSTSKRSRVSVRHRTPGVRLGGRSSGAGLRVSRTSSSEARPRRRHAPAVRRASDIAQDLSAIVAFVDVRGFTRWAEANEVFINLDRFVKGFFEILDERFSGELYDRKPLGDGAMLLRAIPDDLDEQQVQQLLADVLGAINESENDFSRHCQTFARQVGHATELALGWGVVRGKVLEVGDDWTGHNLNKAARLCNEARPFGLVIDRWDFPTLPDGAALVPQTRKLTGIGDVEVWVSPEIASNFIPRERLRETPEVHVAGVCLRERGGKIELLLARRSVQRRIYPGKLEGCGGQLRYSESFEDGVQRHFKTEMGVDVEVLPNLHTLYKIAVPNEPTIPGIRFLCRIRNGSVPSSSNHSELMWVTEGKLRKMHAGDFVGSLRSETLSLLEDYRSLEKP